MVRFARSDGSKGSNKRMLEEPTPWAEMVTQRQPTTTTPNKKKLKTTPKKNETNNIHEQDGKDGNTPSKSPQKKLKKTPLKNESNNNIKETNAQCQDDNTMKISPAKKLKKTPKKNEANNKKNEANNKKNEVTGNNQTQETNIQNGNAKENSPQKKLKTPKKNKAENNVPNDNTQEQGQEGKTPLKKKKKKKALTTQEGEKAEASSNTTESLPQKNKKRKKALDNKDDTTTTEAPKKKKLKKNTESTKKDTKNVDGSEKSTKKPKKKKLKNTDTKNVNGFEESTKKPKKKKLKKTESTEKDTKNVDGSDESTKKPKKKKKGQKGKTDAKENAPPTFTLNKAGHRVKVFKDGTERTWFDLPYEDGSRMTRYENMWVKTEMVQKLNDLKSSLHAEGLGQKEMMRKMMKAKRKAHNQLRIELIYEQKRMVAEQKGDDGSAPKLILDRTNKKDKKKKKKKRAKKNKGNPQNNLEVPQENKDIVQEKYQDLQESHNILNENQEIHDKSEDILQENNQDLQENQDILKENQEIQQENQEILEESQDIVQENQDIVQENQEIQQESQDIMQENQDIMQENQDIVQENNQDLQESQEILRENNQDKLPENQDEEQEQQEEEQTQNEEEDQQQQKVNKSDKWQHYTIRGNPKSEPLVFEENDLMTKFDEYWVLRSDVELLEKQREDMENTLQQRARNGATPFHMTREKTILQRGLKKSKRYRNRLLVQALREGTAGKAKEQSFENDSPQTFDDTTTEQTAQMPESNEVAKFDGYFVKEEGAERLTKLKKKLGKEGLPEDEVNLIMKKERRKEEAELKRSRKSLCLKCRQPGHFIDTCPMLNGDNATICYTCGSTEHISRNCTAKQADGPEFSHATCYICEKVGHISRQCPDNPRGLYPEGGSCRGCGSVEHLARDCPDIMVEKEKETVCAERLDGTQVEALETQQTSPQPKVHKKKKKSKVITF